MQSLILQHCPFLPGLYGISTRPSHVHLRDEIIFAWMLVLLLKQREFG